MATIDQAVGTGVSFSLGEELNWGCSGIGTSVSANGLGAGPVILAGSDEQKATWLPPLLDEPILCSFGLSEPEAGSDVARMKTTAVRRGDEYVLNGSKTFITNAGRAAWTVVFAKTDASKGHRGISAFVVPMDTPGVQIEKHLDKMGQRSTDTSALALTDVVVPAANRIGAEGDGYIKEYPVEKLMRDAKLFQIYEGTSQIQRLVIAKEIFLPRD